jgi:hypothetical protein
MWQYMHDYLVNKKGLRNLIWVYSCGGINGGFPIGTRYPGAAYVDLLGVEIYSSNPRDAQDDYNIMQSTYGKPICMSEFGPRGARGGDAGWDQRLLISALKTHMPNIVYWNQWWAGNAGGIGWGIEIQSNIKAALSDPYVYNRGDFRI